MSDFGNKISELNALSAGNMGGEVPLSLTLSSGTLATNKITLSQLRDLFDFDHAFESIEEGINNTVENQMFYVYVDSNKLSVNEYVRTNIGANAVIGKSGTKKTIYIPALLKHVKVQVESFASLREFKPWWEGQVVYLKGYYTDGVSGSGEFVGHFGTKVDDGGIIASGAGCYWERVVFGNLTPEMFGGVADYDISKKTGTDNFTALQSCIDYATQSPHREIDLLGLYGFHGTLKLAGTNDKNDDDIYFPKITGQNTFQSGLVSTNTESTDIAIEVVSPNYGSQISGRLSNFQLRSSTGKGIGIEYRGTSFQVIDQCYLRSFEIPIHVYNRDAGQFNEFLHIDNTVIDQPGLYGVLFKIKDGDASFHGCSFSETVINIGIGAIGVGCVGTTKTSINLYNCHWNLHLFGRFNETTETFGMYIERCFSTENMIVDISCERPLTFKAGAAARFHSKGIISGHGAITFTCADEETAQQGQYVFSNITSKTSNKKVFSYAGLSTLYPDLYNVNYTADTVGTGGIFAKIFRRRASGVDALTFANYNSVTNNQFSFGYIPVGNDLSQFVPTFEIDNRGAYFKSYAGTCVFDLREADGTDNGGGLFWSSVAVRPKINDKISLGAAGYYFTELLLTNWSISGTTMTPRTTDLNTLGSSTRRFLNGYFKNLTLGNVPTVEGSVLATKVAVPASATAVGTVGQWAADASYYYVCVATNTWVRAALTTW